MHCRPCAKTKFYGLRNFRYMVGWFYDRCHVTCKSAGIKQKCEINKEIRYLLRKKD